MRELERGTSGNDRLEDAEFFRRGNRRRATRDPRGGTRRSDEAERFWSHVDQTDGCWLWTGAKSKGYGRFKVWRAGGWRLVRAHRWAYEQAYGEIPNGIYPDHLCHTNDPACPGGVTCPHRACVRPDHLDGTTDDEENRRRARARRRA